MKTIKYLLPESITIAISFAGIVYAVFAGSMAIGVIAVLAFVAVIISSLKD